MLGFVEYTLIVRSVFVRLNMKSSELEYVELMEKIPIRCRIISLENSSPHWHPEYEVFFVLRGGVTISCEESNLRLEAGDIFLFNSREIHSIILPDERNLCLVLQISPQVFSGIYKTSFRFSLNTKANLPDNIIQRFRSDLARIGLLIHEKPDGYQFFIKSFLFSFIGNLFNHLRYTVDTCEQNENSYKHLEDFDMIKQYIKQHFMEDVSIEQICHDLALSRAKFYRILKGIDSYKNLINYYRVENAKNLLRNTETSISYISYNSGFESNSSFYRIFKETTGLSPGKYRDHPLQKTVPIGIQGYMDYTVSDAITILKKYYNAI